jgi:phage baseplate assembly protein W
MEDYYFKGFTTVNRDKPSYSATGMDLVKIDLLNHFSTRMGERVMLPNFGSIIYDLLMDPLDEISKDAILQDAERIVNEDPRVELRDTQLTETDNSITLEMQLTYLPDGITDSLAIQFNTELQE